MSRHIERPFSAKSQKSLKVRAAELADFARLEPLFKVHCVHIQQSWTTYERVTKQILNSPELGLVLMSEEPSVSQNKDELPNAVAGFLTLTYRYVYSNQTDFLML